MLIFLTYMSVLIFLSALLFSSLSLIVFLQPKIASILGFKGLCLELEHKNPSVHDYRFILIKHFRVFFKTKLAQVAYFYNSWLVSTNHRKIAILYFFFVFISGLTGLLLATIIRIELAYPNTMVLFNNSERYLTTISIHGIVMVFFMIIPLIFGAFGNFLLPTQLGIRDVAFPRLNSFMFWITPSGLVLLIHLLYCDKYYTQFDVDLKFKPQYIYSIKTKKNVNIKDNSDITVCSISNPTLNPETAKITSISNLTELSNYIAYKSTNFINNGFIAKKIFTIINWTLNKNKTLTPQDQKLLTFSQKHAVLNYYPISNLRSVGRVYEPVAPINNEAVNFEFLSPVSLFLRDTQLQYEYLDYVFYEEDLFSSISKVSSWSLAQLIPGWAFITPYTCRLNFSKVGRVDVALVVVLMAAIGSVFSSINYVLTYKYVAAPSFKNRKELRSFFADGLIVASRMMLLANPALILGIIFLLSDRHWKTSIFDFSGGGDAIMFQHLFWFFGHPEVYIIIIPCFGIINSLMPYYLRKRLSGRLSLQYSMYTIAFMSFAVWGHHMYMVGLANTTRTLYSTMTVMISVPASTKILHWCVTLIQSTALLDIPLLFIYGFMYFFVLGGLSGMFVAHIGFDVIFHDTFYVIGHFHVMLSSSAMSCLLAAFYFYFSSIFGFKYNKVIAYCQYLSYFFGQVLTFAPMFWLGYAGMPRRIMDYPNNFGGWNSLISAGHLITIFSFLLFFFNIIVSLLDNKASTSRTRGVSRLNNRLAFYFYERRKLNHFNTRHNLLNKPVMFKHTKVKKTNQIDADIEIPFYSYKFILW